VQRKEVGKKFMLMLICAAVTVGGCITIPAGKYEAFRDSGHSLLTNAGETYARIEGLQRQFAVVTAPDSEITVNTFRPQFEEKSFDLSPELRFREAALEALVKYLNLLSILSAKSRFSSVDRASQELSGSLKNLVESSKLVDRDDASRVSDITFSFDNMADHRMGMGKGKRLNALRVIMDSEQAAVERLSHFVVKGSRKISARVQVMVKTIIVHANSIRPPQGSLERYHFDTRIATLIAESEEIEASLETMSRAVSQIPAAHQEIRDNLEKETTSFEALHVLLQEAQHADKIYRGLY
jgi:hypothetical protein